MSDHDDKALVYVAPPGADPADRSQWSDLGYMSEAGVTVEKTVPDEPVVSWESAGLVARRFGDSLVEGDACKLIALLAMATRAGFQVGVSSKGPGGWTAHTADRGLGFEYLPPSEVCDGWLEVHDTERTMVLTGIATHGEAVDRVRDFLGWAA